MSIVFDPERGGYYSDDGTDSPVDPATGQPLGLPPNTTWGETAPQGGLDLSPGGVGYNLLPQTDPNFDSTWGSYAPTHPEWMSSLPAPYNQAPTPSSSSTGGPVTDTGGGGGGTTGGPIDGPGGGPVGGGGSFSSGTLSNGFGAPPAPFGETYRSPDRPSWLQGPYQAPARPSAIAAPYQAPTWGETFKAPSAGDLEADPGYLAGQTAVQRGLERGASARGSILSGGFAGRTVPRAMNEYAGTAYQNLYGRAFDSYKQRYGQFTDAANRDFAGRQLNESTYQDTANRDLAGRQVNENAFQADVNNGLNAYNARYRGYLDQVNNTRNAESDWWSRENGLAGAGLSATTAGRPA